MRVLLLCLLAVWCAAVTVDRPSDDSALQPTLRLRSRHEDPLSGQLGDRASLLFRALDKDSDRKISEQDVRNSESRLRMHMPGVGVDEFLSFLAIADTDGDHSLTRDELLQGLADGLEESKTLPSALQAQPNLLELESEKAQSGRKAKVTTTTTSTKASASKASISSSAAATSAVSMAALDKAKLWAKSQSTATAKAQAVQKAKHKVTGEVDISQDGCVMCQYIIERCENNIKQSGVIPAYSPTVSFDSYLEVESRAAQMPRQQQMAPAQSGSGSSSPAMDDPASIAADSLMANTVSYAVESMDDVSAMPPLDDLSPVETLDNEPSLSLLQLQEKQLHFDQTAAGIIGSARQSTRVQRQLERQKYNEIYRVVDISLDDVCEQGMPNSFYGFCKQIYKVQTDVVDGFRYQYRPSDICFRIGMCGKDSYITKGLHSRYK